MKRIMLLSAMILLVVLLASCNKAPITETEGPDIPTEFTDDTFAKETETEDERSKLLAAQTPIYAPQDEWEGLETRAYPELNAMASDYILKHPLGNPDYIWEDDAVFDVSRVFATTDSIEYSIQKDDEIKITVSFVKEDPPSGKYEKIYVHRYLNLERRSGDTWERLLYPIVNDDCTARRRHEVIVGEALEMSFFLHGIVTVLTPGQYRIIAYVNSQPVYAEFELTE